MTAASTDAAARARNVRFARVFDEHRDAVWRYCARRVDEDDVDDAVSDVFVVVWRRVEETPDDDRARLWIYGIARNVIRNRQRSTRRRRRLHGRLGSLRADDSPAIGEVADRRATHRDLLRAVDRLAADDRELLRLRTWEELSLAEISTVTHTSVRSVESKLRRIRKKLARTLDDIAVAPADDAVLPSSGIRQRFDRNTWSADVRRGGER